MCLAIPAKVTKLLEHDRACVNIGGVEREISCSLIKEIAVGDYVIVHVGYALTKLNEREAEKTLELFAAMEKQDI